MHRKNLPFWMLLALCCFASSQAQIASYTFENSIEDIISTHHLTYIEDGEVSTNSPDFVSGTTGIEVQMDEHQGLRLPSSINALLDTNTSIEFTLNFSIEEFGGIAENNRVYVIGNQDHVNDKGFTIYTHHHSFSTIEDYTLHFSYSDGQFGATDDHPGHVAVALGTFFKGDDVSIRLIMDFESNQWSAIVNGVLSSGFFTESMDIELVKESIVDFDLYLGYGPGQAGGVDYDPDQWAKDSNYDNLSIYSPKQPGDNSILTTALNAMANHANGSAPLSETVLNSYLTDIQINLDGNFLNAETEINNFISEYEGNYDPIFLDGQTVKVTSLASETQALFFIQQYIFDNQFVADNITNVSGVKFEAAEVFPGVVSDAAPRLNGVDITIDGTYSHVEGARVAHDFRDTKRITGYYVPPGEIVTITIPSSLVNQGISAMVGAHDRDLTGLDYINRFYRISKTFELTSTVTEVANPFGGGLYIKIPDGSSFGDFSITINGAVKSPHFSTRAGRETNLSDWQNQLTNAHVRWTDVESDKFMMTMPIEEMSSLTDPTELLNKWNQIMDGYRYVGGRPYTRARAEYFLVDSRLPNNGFGTGYPQVVSLIDTELFPTRVLEANFYESHFRSTLHEYGHLARHPTVTDHANDIIEVESIIHLNGAYIYNQYFGLSIEEASRHSVAERTTFDETIIDWITTQNFINNNPMSCDPLTPSHVCGEMQYQHRGHIKYSMMAELLGWETVFNMNEVFYLEWVSNFEDYFVRPDDIIRAATEANNINITPLLHFWGMIPSDELRIELQSYPQSQEIYDYLESIKTMIPADQDEFELWYDILVPKKGAVHLPRLDYTYMNYETEDYAARILEQIEFIQELYFPALSVENNSEKVIGIYPNPTDGLLYLQSDQPLEQYRIIDVNGRIIKTSSFEQNQQEYLIDVQDVSIGIYVVETLSQGVRTRNKFIKK